MRKSTSFIFLLTCLLLSSPAAAQLFPDHEIRFDHLLPGSNMTENSINCFLQDRQGFMWIGTKNGLFRYDGHEMKSCELPAKPGTYLKGSFIRCLCELARDELLLIGTDEGGLYVYDKKTGHFTQYIHLLHDSTTIGSNKIFDMLEDREGHIWIATAHGGLNLFDIQAKQFSRYYIDAEKSKSNEDNFFKCLYLDAQDGLWVGTRYSGLYLFDRKRKTFRIMFRETDDPENRLHNEVWSLCQDHNNNLWIGTEEKGLFLLKGERDKNYRIEKLGKADGFFHKAAVKVFCDQTGTIWVGAWAGGLYKYNQKTKKFILYQNDPENPQSLSSNHVLTVYQDRAGSIWIGTHAGGINVIQPQKFKFHAYQFNKYKKNTIHINQVRSILYDKAANIFWLGTAKGLIKLNIKTGEKSNFCHIPHQKESLLHDAVNTMCTGKEPDILWIGTPLGLSRLNTRTNRFKHYRTDVIYRDGPSNINISDMILDNQGILWIGSTHIGLIRFDPVRETFRLFPDYTANSSPFASVQSILEYDDQLLYLGCYEGLLVFNKMTETFSPFSQDETLVALTTFGITSMHRDAENILWIGTPTNGLVKYDPSNHTYKQFTQKTGLASNAIHGILEHRNGIFYISSDRGISYFDSYQEQFKTYGMEDGMHGTEFFANSYYKSGDGRMFFGGVNGLTFFDPEKMPKNEYIPPIHITRLEILYRQQQVFDNLLYTSYIELPHTMNSFSFDFIALNFINSHKNKYLYMLEGYDQEWQEAGSTCNVIYKNVKPGEYTFRVIGSNNDGIWNEKGDALTLYIKPAIWQTITFRIFISVLILVIVGYVIRRRFYLLRRDAEIRRRFTHDLIKNQESERKRIAAELHDSLGQDLLVIKNRTTVALRKDNRRGSKDNQLEQICAIADEAISNIRRVAHNLHPYQLEKLGLTDSLKSMLDKINEASTIEIEYEMDNIDGLLAKDQEINCYRVLQELLNNILKHSKAVKAWIKVHRLSKFIELDVQDNGVGFDHESVRDSGHGFGLTGVQERVDILKGRLAVESGKKAGTRFVIEIPI
ncbi:hypothetical protein JXO59_14495 [candidate division KSB1 bacterium]|nr:hypothetical protein [candidate division KSB1 bacterium]